MAHAYENAMQLGPTGLPIRPDNLDEFEPITDMPLDSGIRAYVLALRSGGVETYESCEGGDGHCFPEPTVRFNGGIGEGYRAYGIALLYGLPVAQLRRTYYATGSGMLEGPWWEMTFTTKAKK